MPGFTATEAPNWGDSFRRSRLARKRAKRRPVFARIAMNGVKHPDLRVLMARIRTAEHLAALGGRPQDGPAGSWGTRLWSRARSTLGLLFTARQKRFNQQA